MDDYGPVTTHRHIKWKIVAYTEADHHIKIEVQRKYHIGQLLEHKPTEQGVAYKMYYVDEYFDLELTEKIREDRRLMDCPHCFTRMGPSEMIDNRKAPGA